MKAVILCGGQGTRIRSVDELLPKPMLPIGERPIVWHIMKLFSHYGIDDFVLCLGYKSWLFKEWFMNYRSMLTDMTINLAKPGEVTFHDGHELERWRVTLAETGVDTMTGGRISGVRHHIGESGLFLVTYGDGVADVDINALVDFHKSHGKIATVTAVRPPSRFGEMLVEDGRVACFTEKPQVSEGSVNGGFFVFDAKRIWDYIPNAASTILERAPLQRLAEEGELAAYVHQGFWQPMDTPREFRELNELWDSGRAPWKVWSSDSRVLRASRPPRSAVA
ncbi:MAG TPA: glucose-1-phosphate cytidylyltransferase [Polyangiaceae bacterium]|nr:glucose-1-phosphate cytidylyltransferase [Polyangiaceae bacterium]